MQIAQDISSRVQCKKRRRSGLRRGFLCCAIGEIDKSRCVSYFSTVPYSYTLRYMFSFGLKIAIALGFTDFRQRLLNNIGRIVIIIPITVKLLDSCGFLSGNSVKLPESEALYGIFFK